MAFAQINLQKILSSPNMQRQINTIKHMGELRLTEAIWDNVYTKYKPEEYIRTYELLHSVSSSFKITGDTIEIKVFCDPDKMHHIANKPYGMPVFVPVLLDGGHTQDGYEGTNDMYHDYPKRDFLNKAIKQIENDMQQSLVTAIVTAIRTKKAY